MSIKENLSKLLRRFRLLSLFAVIVFLVLDGCIFLISREVALTILVFVLLFAAAILWLYYNRNGELRRLLIPFSIDQSQMQYEVMKQLPFAYGLVDENGMIYWVNETFSGIFSGETLLYRNIETLCPELRNLNLSKNQGKEYGVSWKDKHYHVSFFEINTPVEMETNDACSMFTMCLQDDTRIVNMEQEIREQRMVVGSAYLDNYEEILNTIDEVRMSLIIAHIDRKVTKYFSQMGGIVKKIERDKYFLVIPRKNIETMKADRFMILDEIRDMKIPNEQHMTMSIGLGIGDGSFSVRHEHARTAVEMALARGGDQVAIKNNDEIEYIGGSAQTVARTTRVKARVKAHALKELLMNTDDVLIMGHKIPDLDAIGAATGVYHIAHQQGKKAHIVLNEISTSIRPVVERLSKSVNQSMFISGTEAQKIVTANTLLIIVDTNRGSYTECPELLSETLKVVVIDHHRKSNDSITGALLDYVEPYASSACELVTEILQYMGDEVKLRNEEADAMYAGIVMDTNNFINKTGVRTFEAAAILRRSGADTVRVRKLFRENLAEYKARAEAVRRAEIYMDKFALSTCPAEKLESPTIAGAQAANELLDIKDVEASIVLTKYKDKIYLSARSIDSVNVQVIMEKLGGGGHGTMAGAQMTGCTIEEAMEYVKVTLHEMREKGEI